jgi:hypothetical protein
MMKGEQQKILHKGSNAKINAFVTLLYTSNKIKFKITTFMVTESKASLRQEVLILNKFCKKFDQ